MSKTKNTAKILMLLLILLASLTASAATIDSNRTLSLEAKNAQNQLNQLQETIQKIQYNKLTTQRINDLLTIATQAYIQELEQEKYGNSPDYTQTLNKIKEANQIVQLALQTKTELDTLKTQINDTKTQNPNADFTETTKSYQNAQNEFKNERYELAEVKIQETYSKLTQATTLQAKTSAMYEETAKTITNYLQNNWQTILAILATITILYLILRNQIKKARLKNKIKAAEQELKIIQELIKKTQKDYFQKNTMPQTIYNSRVKTYMEKIRDLHAKIASLNEQLATASNKNPQNNKK
ncbi:MAG: hypothetical protein Q7K34_03500 [archaeon]|nr:hypothetical protein [archaeon]